MPHRIAVVVPTPAHSGVSGPLSYRSELPLEAGALVRVPLGRREVLGVVWGADAVQPPDASDVQERPVTAGA